MSRRPLFLIMAGTLTFGLLTFAAGLLVGLGLQPGVGTGGADKPPKPPVAAGSSAGAMPAAAPAPPAAGTASGAAVPAAPGEATAPAAAASPNAATPPAPPVAPAGPPVKGLRSGAVGAGEAGPLVRALAAADPEASPPSVPDRIVSVEVGRFLLVENAAAFAAQLGGQGYEADILLAAFPGMAAWHVVTLGVQPDEQTASLLAREVSQRTGLEARVVSWPRPTS